MRGGRRVALAAALVVGATMATWGGRGSAGPEEARAVLKDTSGATVGTARLIQQGGKVQIRVGVQGLPPGFHGFHVHTTGLCDPAASPPFGTAGGHFNPGGASHPAHAADLPVLLVNEDGTGIARVKTDRFSIEDLIDADGSAFIVHANPDNYANIPTDRYDPDPDATTLSTGDAGGRIACGIIAILIG